MQPSARFPWKSEYTVGNESIDEQHRTLLELAGLLHMAVAAGQGYKIIQNAFAALVKYTEEHFSDEEQFWIDAKSAVVEKHKRLHRQITEELLALRFEGPYGVVFCTPNELTNWVEHRLIVHFIEEDQGVYRSLTPNIKRKRASA
ncbi:hypothetical protein D9623_09550 [Azospirillum brasilense]|uniref:Hemerythrin family protein n=1 Tax=Azospirillum brasilense TaxID=192 RepID=A0A0P0ECX2_AZOBR|nr:MULTISPECIES: hemerythrin family protein [Azospirillum]ALJ35529.1 hypothetical protein AMK58_08885 [Azospirillum brasilense]MDW7555611.1 hemerythrin family protein [Azospirillum brasilense]MDW7595538.1 hemerythrin family protein [Azospirillum brasilense]MDW7630543.1 hemerythrin family protein [Azospirillum brasilense]MDX5954261.1 hemerythrin family protein [Azospirillum brasilense]